MQIQPNFLPVDILLRGRLFRIPEYQRAYSWQKKQRDDLFRDIESVRASGNDATHFMATIVGLKREKVSIIADQFARIDVVDGQQRLTTICILLKSIEKALVNDDKAEAKLAEELRTTLVKGDDVSLLLLQTNHDSSHVFVDYLRKGTSSSKQAALTTAEQNLLTAINDCETFVTKWRTDRSTLIELLGIIKNRLVLIFHEIEDEGLVYKVFEVLNSRGLDVTWFDKLKSQLMALVFEHAKGGNRGEIIKELHSLWQDIYRTIGLRQGLNQETVRFAGTLRAPDLAPNRPLNEERSVQLLVEQCGHSPRKVIECSKWLLSIVVAEDRLLTNHRLRAVSDILQARLVAIAILLRDFAEADEKKLLRLWEAVAFRIYGLFGEDARKEVGTFVRLAWQIMNEKLSANQILKELSAIGAKYPITEAVKYLWRENCYDGWTEQLRYFFFRYEEYIAREAGQRLNESQWNKIWEQEPSKSVEHIRPRSYGSENPGTSGVFVHRLGNLMMLPPGVNSKLQDADPKIKAETYLTCGLLTAIGVGKIAKKLKWNRETIERREKGLMKWASTEWAD